MGPTKTFERFPGRLPAIGEGYAEVDQLVIRHTLTDLLPHIEGAYCICGGVATQCALSQAGQTRERDFNDIDLVIQNLDDIQPSVKDSFDVKHYHPADPVDGFYVQLAHKPSDTVVDIFGWDRFPPEPVDALLHSNLVKIRSPANQLWVYLSAIYRRVTQDMPIIPKQLDDAKALAQAAAADTLDTLVQGLNPAINLSADDFWGLVNEYLRQHPGRLLLHHPPKPARAQCQDCASF